MGERTVRTGPALAVVSAAVFMASLDLFIVNIAFPDIARDFGATSLANLSWVLNGYTIVFASLLVPLGRTADRFGRRRFFIGGLLLFVAASAAAAAAPSIEALVAARVVQAVGAAALMPTSLALLLAEIPLAKRATAIGIWAATGGIAAAAGPPLGGLLVEASWRWVFLINVPIGLAAAFAATRVLRESSDPAHARRPDVLGAALLTVAVGLLALGLVKAPDWGWVDVRTIAALAGSALALASFVYRSAHHPSPIVELPMIRVRSFSMASTTAFLFSAGFGAMLLGGVLFLTSIWDYSVLEAGIAFAPGPFSAAVFALPAGRLGPRVGTHVLATLGCLLFAAGAAWWALRAGSDPAYFTELLPGMLLTGMGVGLTLPSVSAAAVSELPPARLATGSAVLQMSRQLGIALGVAILIAIFGHPSPQDALAHFHAGWWFMAAVALMGAVAASRIPVPQTQNQVTPALAQSAGSP
ncbi:MAG TPA: DHA2 family efflux MFS transporter permease subunit [Thermoleophilaceae bacterium]|nr:DHA2 family efflux MFS transporter permease subunit [Thermoleophilaceae bacterium]